MKINFKYLLFSLFINLLCFFIVSFIKWDFTWFLDIYKWHWTSRLFMIAIIIVKEFLTILAYNDFIDK